MIILVHVIQQLCASHHRKKSSKMERKGMFKKSDRKSLKLLQNKCVATSSLFPEKYVIHKY